MTDDEYKKLKDAVQTLRGVEMAVESPVSCLESALGERPEEVDFYQVRRSLRSLHNNLHIMLECFEEAEQEIESALPNIWDTIREAYEQGGIFKAILEHRRNLGSSFLDAKEAVENRIFAQSWVRVDDE